MLYDLIHNMPLPMAISAISLTLYLEIFKALPQRVGGPRTEHKRRKMLYALTCVLWTATLLGDVALLVYDRDESVFMRTIETFNIAIAAIWTRRTYLRWSELDDDDDEPGALTRLRGKITSAARGLVRMPSPAAAA